MANNKFMGLVQWGMWAVVAVGSVTAWGQVQTTNDDQRVRAAVAAFTKAYSSLDAAGLRACFVDPDVKTHAFMLENIEDIRNQAREVDMVPADFFSVRTDVYRTSVASNLWSAEGLMHTSRQVIDRLNAPKEIYDDIMVFILAERDGVLKVDKLVYVIREQAAIEGRTVIPSDAPRMTRADNVAFHVAVTNLGMAFRSGKREVVELELAGVDAPTRERLMRGMDFTGTSEPVVPMFASDTTQPIRILMDGDYLCKTLAWVRVFPGLTPESRATGDLLELEYRKVNGRITLVRVSKKS